MLTLSIAACVIGFVIMLASQFFFEEGIVSADSRNLCVVAFFVWLAITLAVFIFGVFALIANNFLFTG